MRIHRSYIIYILLLISFATCTTSKSLLVPRYEKETSNKHLKGPVKLMKTQIHFLDSSITRMQKRDYFISFRLGGADDFMRPLAFEFDIFGRQTKRWLIDSINQVLKENSGASSIYNEQDFALKKDCKQKEFPRYTYNPYRLKLNKKSFSLVKVKGEKDSADLKTYDRYVYMFDNTDKVLKEFKINDWDKELDGNPDVIDTIYVANYSYNNKDQLIEKQFEFLSKYPEPFKIVHNYDAYRRYETKEKYTYNDTGLLSSVKLFYGNSIFFSEEYTYDKKNQLVKLRRIKVGDFMTVNKKAEPYKDLFFNTKGEVNKIIAYSDEFKTPFATYYYIYKNYDAHGNWTYCELHLDGEIKETPTMIAKRIIEYYEN